MDYTFYKFSVNPAGRIASGGRGGLVLESGEEGGGDDGNLVAPDGAEVE